MDRRLIVRNGIVVLAAALGAAPALAQAKKSPVDVRAILDDPDAPVGGDPKGDVPIVIFFDYLCPSCRKAMPELARLARDDGHIKLIYKDWPILSKTSVVSAKLALAARYQGKHEVAHKTLMALSGPRTEEDMTKALGAAGIDLARLQADLDSHDAEIVALLQRNREQAEALGLPGTPVFLIGPYKIAQPLDYEGFKRVVTQVRGR
ncbi:thioredoxin domain-containing protein [Rhodoblastus acidophilus]|uniref:Thioredoxin domain-containing protein n=1 Tax=Rhodoblastus acidophilus TaxID=1074 RepID=A0A6N8DMK2_RHOAC|nr:DsbA family protein [Rhodoblastus acidophilus]MCW2275358.1 protein-disulfide isomerase [Rhodoblastus acidophilus]MTV31750.1 thioredoxin domain-containing protein [Rhodoblastus acidophilus]